VSGDASGNGRRLVPDWFGGAGGGTDSTAAGSPETPVVKDRYDWEAFKQEYYYDDAGDPPEDGDGVRPFDAEAYLGFDPGGIEAASSIWTGTARP